MLWVLALTAALATPAHSDLLVQPSIALLFFRIRALTNSLPPQEENADVITRLVELKVALEQAQTELAAVRQRAQSVRDSNQASTSLDLQRNAPSDWPPSPSLSYADIHARRSVQDITRSVEASDRAAAGSAQDEQGKGVKADAAGLSDSQPHPASSAAEDRSATPDVIASPPGCDQARAVDADATPGASISPAPANSGPNVAAAGIAVERQSLDSAAKSKRMDSLQAQVGLANHNTDVQPCMLLCEPPSAHYSFNLFTKFTGDALKMPVKRPKEICSNILCQGTKYGCSMRCI